jgi:integrase
VRSTWRFEEKIGRNPCSTVPTPKRPVLDGEQVMQLLGAARDVQERALFTLAITTGMRQGEIFATLAGRPDRLSRYINRRNRTALRHPC